jgi:hypothetical protein
VSEIDERLPHPTHIGLNIAKAIPDDRPEQHGDGLAPHPEPVRLAGPILEVLPEDGTLPSTDYLDQIAAECGETLARVWELPEDEVVAWVRDGLDRGLAEAPERPDRSGDEQPDADGDAHHDEQGADEP